MQSMDLGVLPLTLGTPGQGTALVRHGTEEGWPRHLEPGFLLPSRDGKERNNSGGDTNKIVFDPEPSLDLGRKGLKERGLPAGFN